MWLASTGSRHYEGYQTNQLHEDPPQQPPSRRPVGSPKGSHITTGG